MRADFVEEYTAAAASFAEQALDPSVGPLAAIARLAHNMAQDGYTPSLAYPFSMSRAFGEGVIRKSLERTLVDSEGVLEGGAAGRAMVVNFGCLNHRRSLVEELSTRPSPLGEGQVLVMHGTLDKAVSSSSSSSIPLPRTPLTPFAVPLRTLLPHSYRLRCRSRQRRALRRRRRSALRHRHSLAAGGSSDRRVDQAQVLVVDALFELEFG